MSVSAYELLEVLPPYSNNDVIIKNNQSVHDIVREVIDAHKYFEEDYDRIYEFFDTGDLKETCLELFEFCKDNICYVVETEDMQTTKSPAAILAIGKGDCKHFAGIIAGILSAIERNTGEKINWCYAFASYSYIDSSPAHVFVIVKANGKDYWIDPVLNNFDQRTPKPVYMIEKKVKTMLHRISGIGNVHSLGAISDDIEKLLFYGIIDNAGLINFAKYNSVINSLTPNDAADLQNAADNFMQSQRDAFLKMVSSNTNRYADVINRITVNLDGSTNQDTLQEITTIWNNLGGNIDDLLNAAKMGSKISGVIGQFAAEASAIASGASSVINAFSGLFNAKTNAAAQIDKDQTSVELAALQIAQQRAANPLSSLSQYLPIIIIGVVAYVILKK